MNILSLLPAKARPYAKTVIATLGTILATVSLSVDLPDWVAVVLSVLTALGVYAQPNEVPDVPGRHEA
jgi:hypothetical protein